MDIFRMGRGLAQWVQYGAHSLVAFRAHLDKPEFARLAAGYVGPVKIASLRAGGSIVADLLLRRNQQRFQHAQQQPALYFPFLSARPFHPVDAFAELLESHSDAIRDEFHRIESRVHGHPETWLVENGRWDIFKLYRGGLKHESSCAQAPVTTGIIEQLPHCGRWLGMVYFSVLQPGTYIKPHSGLTNGRIRYHLGIEVADDRAWIEVGGERRPWENGRCMVFDDSFRHHVVHGGTKRRVVLIVDLWHPQLSDSERHLLASSGLATGFEVPFDQ